MRFVCWLIWFLSNSRRFFIIDSLNWVEQLIFTCLFYKNELILLIDLNCAYLVSNKLSSDSNSLVVDSIKLFSVVQSFNCICYDSSYASMLITMLMTMLMTMFMTIVDRSSLDYRIVPKSILFRVSLCSSESYR